MVSRKNREIFKRVANITAVQFLREIRLINGHYEIFWRNENLYFRNAHLFLREINSNIETHKKSLYLEANDCITDDNDDKMSKQDTFIYAFERT